jgi:hypothetical protein
LTRANFFFLSFFTWIFTLVTLTGPKLGVKVFFLSNFFYFFIIIFTNIFFISSFNILLLKKLSFVVFFIFLLWGNLGFMTQVSGFSVWPKFTRVFFIIFLRIKLIFKFCPLTFGWLGMELYSFFILFSSHEIISILWSKCGFERFAQVNLGFFFLNLIFFFNFILSIRLIWNWCSSCFFAPFYGVIMVL